MCCKHIIPCYSNCLHDLYPLTYRKTHEKVYSTYLFSLIITLTILVLCFLILFKFVLLNISICGDSMYPTLSEQDFKIANRLAYTTRDVRRGDVISFWSDELQLCIIKRVIGLPGETISFSAGYTYVDGNRLEESSYLPANGLTYSDAVFTVPENCFFVMGDNRLLSYDSRDFINPYIPKSAILGRVLIDIKPFLLLLNLLLFLIFLGLLLIRRKHSKTKLQMYDYIKQRCYNNTF